MVMVRQCDVRHSLVQFTSAVSLIMVLLRERAQMGLRLRTVKRVERGRGLGGCSRAQLGAVVACKAVGCFVVCMGMLDHLDEFTLYLFQILRQLSLRIQTTSLQHRHLLSQ